MNPLVVIGDCLLDRDVEGTATRLAPDAPAPVLEEEQVSARPGGAGLAAVLATRDDRDVVLITALARDRSGDELRELLRTAGVRVIDLGSSGTTSEKIRLRTAGRCLARWDRGRRTTAADIGPWTDEAQAALDAAGAILVSCYGRGLSSHRGVRGAVAAVVDGRPVVWDPHTKGSPPVPGVTVVTPNAGEALVFAPQIDGDTFEAVTERARTLARGWEVGGVAVTLGARGALFTTGHGLPLVAPAPATSAGDSCGAGDRFAAALAGHLANGALPSESVVAAVREAARFVAAGGAANVHLGGRPDEREAIDDAFDLAEHVRARGGTVVATGGCFDLVHAGHVHVLEAARALGDCLIVCLNSDRSVQRLKGPQRPIVPQEDRADLLRALSCVDAVVVFGEDTPVEVLRRLRPDVFAKGGDYGTTRIPEEEVLARWGGQAVTLPYLEGRSTTNILQEVRGRER